MAGLNSQNNENLQNGVNSLSNPQENSQNSATPSLRASEASVAIHNGKGDFKAVDCHDFANAKSRNDTLSRHTERSEVSTNDKECLNSQMDSSLSAKAQNDGEVSQNQNRDISPTAQYDNVNFQSARNDSPKLALVVPCYNEEAVIAQSYKVLNAKIQALISQHKIAQDSFICFVDDGSKDKTCEILLALKSGLNSQNSATSSLRDLTKSSRGNPQKIQKFCHIERSEISKNSHKESKIQSKSREF